MRISPVRVIVGLVLLAAAIQLIPIQRDNPPVSAEINLTEDLELVFRKACYDCHSNETSWPWYSNIAPVSWLVVHDTRSGRRHLNFSEWGLLPEKKRHELKNEIWDTVEEGEMPLWFYVLVHSEAKLTEDERTLIQHWSRQSD